MIELIFAIVVLGITMMSAPLLISQATSSSRVTFQQESIAITAAHTSALMTYAWDETNTRQGNNIAILGTPNASTDDALEANATNPQYRGNVAFTFPNARKRRFNIINDPQATTIAYLGNETDADTRNDDIDDFRGNGLNLISIAGTQNKANQGEYMDTNITLTTAVSYGRDAANYAADTINFNTPFVASLTASNIKTVNVTFTSNNTDTNILLQAFMCNIGSSKPETREGI